MALWKKVVLGTIAVPVLCFFGFFLFFYIGTSVGYLIFMFTYWDMEPIVTRVKEHSMHANTGFPVAEKNGELVREAYSDIYVSRDESNQRSILRRVVGIWEPKDMGILKPFVALPKGLIRRAMNTRISSETGGAMMASMIEVLCSDS